ncbi:MAG: hypothetical protein IPP71_21360 [Bacteroidetes bacterium]|nr:hypothetical protein [Bacteroidota bacterium]
MKLIGFFTMFLFIISCMSNKHNVKNDAVSKSNPTPVISDTTSYFNLLNATSEPWVAGIRGGGSGIEHSFQIFIISDQKLIFEKVWMKDNVFEVFVSKNQNAITSDPVQYTKNEVITVRVSEFQRVNAEKILPPLQYEGEALIGFKVNGQQKYFIVKEIKKLPTLYRQ